VLVGSAVDVIVASNEVNKPEKADAATIAKNPKDVDAAGCIFSPSLPTSLPSTAVSVEEIATALLGVVCPSSASALV